jgi:hypothetical protein
MANQSNTRRMNNHEYYRMITFKANPDLDERLTEAAEKKNLSISELIRQCCVTALANEEAIEI